MGIIHGPSKPKRITNLEIPSGLHLLVADTNMGKTLHGMALAYHTDGNCLYCNEPRSETPKDPTLKKLLGSDGMLNRKSIMNVSETEFRGTLTVVDSINDLFFDEEKSPGLGRGLSWPQQAFFKRLSQVCFRNQIVCVGVANLSLVPRADAFDGVVEGFITIKGPGLLSWIDRDGRQLREIQISTEAMQKACDELDYGTYEPSKLNSRPKDPNNKKITYRR